MADCDVADVPAEASGPEAPPELPPLELTNEEAARLPLLEKLDLDTLKDEECADFTNKLNKTIGKALEGVAGDGLVFVSLINNRVTKIDGLDRFAKIRRLDLRANQIAEIENIAHLSELQELDLYENHIETVRNLSFARLIVLDLSFNRIRTLSGDALARLPRLRELYLVQNKIKAIPDSFAPVARTLHTLELGANRIREIDNLHPLTELRNLWLGKNKISEIKNLSALTNLRILSLQNNRLTSVSQGLLSLVNLEELYLSENKIEKLENVHTLGKLRTLDVGLNALARVENVKELASLEELWLNNNKIESMRDAEEIKHLRKLTTVYLEHNPLAADTQYRNKVQLLVPSIRQIDATMVVTRQQRQQALDGAASKS